MELYLKKGFVQNNLCTQDFEAALSQLKENGGGTLIVPSGIYHTGPIELSSNITLHLEKGATIYFSQSYDAFPMLEYEFSGCVQMRPKPCVFVKEATNVSITGEGVFDGVGHQWWQKFRENELPHGRPFLFHAEDCKNLIIQDVTFRNSPIWTLHPVYCENIIIENVTVLNPWDSPNTDGINPESCNGVQIKNCNIDVGDDCITLKAGVEKTDRKAPCQNIDIRNCRFLHGHGGVVVGSEMSGDVKNVKVTDCVFTDTDRGLRIKTRRKRGGIVDNIVFKNCTMENVICPFVISMYYTCQTREEDKYSWDKSFYPVQTDTPCIQNVEIENVQVKDAHACAGFFYGLPEMPIMNISIKNSTITMARNPKSDIPAMLRYAESMAGKGFICRNIKGLKTENFIIENAQEEVWDVDHTVEF